MRDGTPAGSGSAFPVDVWAPGRPVPPEALNHSNQKGPHGCGHAYRKPPTQGGSPLLRPTPLRAAPVGRGCINPHSAAHSLGNPGYITSPLSLHFQVRKMDSCHLFPKLHQNSLGWGRGSAWSTGPASAGPAFNPQYHKKTKSPSERLLCIRHTGSSSEQVTEVCGADGFGKMLKDVKSRQCGVSEGSDGHWGS